MKRKGCDWGKKLVNNLAKKRTAKHQTEDVTGKPKQILENLFLRPCYKVLVLYINCPGYIWGRRSEVSNSRNGRKGEPQGNQ